jgi:hypothetical protein
MAAAPTGLHVEDGTPACARRAVRIEGDPACGALPEDGAMPSTRAACAD